MVLGYCLIGYGIFLLFYYASTRCLLVPCIELEFEWVLDVLFMYEVVNLNFERRVFALSLIWNIFIGLGILVGNFLMMLFQLYLIFCHCSVFYQNICQPLQIVLDLVWPMKLEFFAPWYSHLLFSWMMDS